MDTTPGFATPMPEQPFSSSPAWDPSSRTPISEAERDSDVGSTSLARRGCPLGIRVRDEIRHVLLDLRLLNTSLHVILCEAGSEKEIVAIITSAEGQLCIRRKHYQTSTTLNPDLVTPQNPNPTRGNGLLVVIEGDHCGKYVRRIHHRYEDGVAILSLAVVRRDVGNSEILTDERLDLDKSHLCVCDESKDERKNGDSLMRELREEARKTRAK